MMMGMMGNDSNANNNDDSNRTLVNITAYQQAQGLAIRAQQIFNSDLKPRSSINVSSSSSSSSANTDTITAVNKIGSDLIDLKNAIDSKASTMDVMKIVHGDIHPALLISYNLQLRR